MAMPTKTSTSFSELLAYVQFAFPEQSSSLEEMDELNAFIEQWEQEFSLLYSKLVSKTSNGYLTEEEKTYSCTCKAMCSIYNSISNILEPAKA